MKLIAAVVLLVSSCVCFAADTVSCDPSAATACDRYMVTIDDVLREHRSLMRQTGWRWHVVPKEDWENRLGRPLASITKEAFTDAEHKFTVLNSVLLELPNRERLRLAVVHEMVHVECGLDMRHEDKVKEITRRVLIGNTDNLCR